MADKENERTATRFHIPLWYRIRRRLLLLPPLLIWLAAFVGAAILYVRQEQGLTVTGFASEIRYSVAPESSGRLKSLEVSCGDEVCQDQFVARLDDTDLLCELQAARMELERLRGELGRQKALWELSAAGQQTDQQANLRRFARDVENAHIEYLDGLAGLAEDKIRLQGLELIVNRSRALHDSEIETLANMEEDLIACQALAESVAQQKALVDEMRRRYEKADSRYGQYVSEHLEEIPETEILLKPLEYAIKVQEVQIERANLAISKLVLEAPACGRVAAIFHRPGEFVNVGQPVLSIVDPNSTEIVAYLPETRLLDIEEGTEVVVRRKFDPGMFFRSTVAFLGPSVEQLPARLFPGSMTPSWGVAVHIPVPETLAVKPGEAIEVGF